MKLWLGVLWFFGIADAAARDRRLFAEVDAWFGRRRSDGPERPPQGRSSDPGSVSHRMSSTVVLGMFTRVLGTSVAIEIRTGAGRDYE